MDEIERIINGEDLNSLICALRTHVNELRSSLFVKINGGCNLERDRNKKEIVDI